MGGTERGIASDPALLLAFQFGKASDRKFRLFACACCRLLWNLLPAHPGRFRVENAELRADDKPPSQPRWVEAPPPPVAAESAAIYADVASIFSGCDDAFGAALVTSAMVDRALPEGGMASQAAVVDDIFGRPSRPFDPSWRSPELVTLAQSLYDQRRFKNLSRLSELLEHSGCDDRKLLNHLRSGGPHFRGCWALDILLSKS